MWEDAREWVDDDAYDLPDYALKPQYANRLAFALDGSGYKADLITRAGFGCVQWETSDV